MRHNLGKLIRRCVAGFVVVIVAVGWVARYKSLNCAYATMEIPRKEAAMGDEIVLGDEIISYDAAPGYTVTVLDAEILSYAEYSAKASAAATGAPPEYVVDVTMQIRNRDSEALGIYLLDFLLYSIDFYTDVNEELTAQANPVLEEGSYGISLKQGNEYQAHIIYNLRASVISEPILQHLEKVPLFLQITSYPERLSVRLN